MISSVLWDVISTLCVCPSCTSQPGIILRSRPPSPLSCVVRSNCMDLKRVLKLARSASVSYKPPDRHDISNTYLQASYMVHKKNAKRAYMVDIETFGASLASDGATIHHHPLANWLIGTVTGPYLLKIVDCSEFMAAGGTKDGPFIANDATPIVDEIGAKLFDLIMFDGAGNMEVAGAILVQRMPWSLHVHGTEHVCALVFDKIAKEPEVLLDPPPLPYPPCQSVDLSICRSVALPPLLPPPLSSSLLGADRPPPTPPPLLLPAR